MALFEDDGSLEYFLVSLKLADVCDSLGRDSSSLSEKQSEDLSWAEDLMKRVDWRNPIWNKGTSAEIAVLATDIRPFFYEIIMQNLDYNHVDFSSVLARENKNERDIKTTKNFLKLLSNRCFAECQRGSHSYC